MDFSIDFWKYLNNRNFPSIEETEELVNSYDWIVSDKVVLTDYYIKLQQLYKYLFSIYFNAKCKLYSLDERILQKGYLPLEEDKMNYFQKYDFLNLNYFYLFSFIHIEFLNEDELKPFIEYLDINNHDEQLIKSAMDIVEKTYKRVVAVNYTCEKQWYELLPDIYGENRVQGNNLVLGLSSMPEFDKNGFSVKNDSERINTMYSIKKQLEPILSKCMDTNMKIIVQI